MYRYFKAILPIYTIFLLYMMLFGMGREAGEIGNLQLTPFKSIERFFSPVTPMYDFFINIVCNIVVFTPFGLIGILNKWFNSIFIILPSFVLFIILVELVQHFSGRGVADIDDVILNTIGMLSGFLFCHIYNKINSAIPDSAFIKA